MGDAGLQVVKTHGAMARCAIRLVRMNIFDHGLRAAAIDRHGRGSVTGDALRDGDSERWGIDEAGISGAGCPNGGVRVDFSTCRR